MSFTVSKKSLPTPMFAEFSYYALMVSGHRFRSLIRWVDFCVWYNALALFHTVGNVDSFSQHDMLKMLSVLPDLLSVNLLKVNWLWICELTFGISFLFHWSSYLFLCQCQAVLIAAAMCYISKPGCNVSSFLLFKI